MEWLTSMKQSIEYMEDNLLENISADDVAEEVHMSPYYLQKGFQILTGYSVMEYIRNRRLYLAALELLSTDEKIIDTAFKYGYETPESFTKAFARFHGATPSQLKKNAKKIRPFLPLKISITIQGGNDMDYTVEKMKGFSIIGFEREFDYETGKAEIPKFWGEIFQSKIAPWMGKREPQTEEEKMISESCLGQFGASIDDHSESGKFRYFVAGEYKGGEIPEGMSVYEFPDTEWAKFTCVGPMPAALQTVNNQIFKEWLPGNKEYELAAPYNIEWYSSAGGTTDLDYESAIWIPVKRK